MTLRSRVWLSIIAPRKLPIQPGSGHIPIADDGDWRKLQNLGGLFDTEAAKEPQLHHRGFPRIDFRQRIQGVIDCDKLCGPIYSDIHRLVHRNAFEPAAPLQVLTPCVVHQYSPHHLRGNGKEMSAILPAHPIAIDQPKVSFIHESRRLKRMTRAFPRHQCSGLPPKLVVNNGRQLVECGPVATAPSNQELGYVRSASSAHIRPMIVQTRDLRLSKREGKTVALLYAFRQPAITIFGVLAAWPQAIWTSKQRSSACPLIASILFASAVAFAADDAKRWLPDIPKVWDEAALENWMTPLVGLNVRPTHVSAKEYYSMPEWNFRSYPVYMAGSEPEGYWEMLQHIGPKPLIEPEKLKTEAEWIEAGRRVFEEAEAPQLTILDPKVIAQFRSREFLEQQHLRPRPDGTLDFRWVPTKRGIALSRGGNCGGCHVLTRSNGTRIAGASARAEVSRSRPFQSGAASQAVNFFESANHVLRGAPPFFMGGGALGDWLYQAWGVPWLKDDPNLRLKKLTAAEYNALVAEERQGGAITRWNGSILFPAKMPDLIGIKERKYIDHTATHLHRGIGDLMRYAAQVSFAEITDFGPYHVLAPDTRRVQARWPDAALYALALYIYSLQPPPNPNPFDAKAEAGQKIFMREGCATCHTPPLFTNNKLTLAKGFTPPKNKPESLDVLPMSVGTDSGLALRTRKGTGYYKVPSLKGLWYRGHYLHDGSVASLEEMFDPDRLKASHVPGGWMPVGAKSHAIQGHEFGLKLVPEEREQLVAFLRTL